MMNFCFMGSFSSASVTTCKSTSYAFFKCLAISFLGAGVSEWQTVGPVIAVLAKFHFLHFVSLPIRVLCTERPWAFKLVAWKKVFFFSSSAV